MKITDLELACGLGNHPCHHSHHSHHPLRPLQPHQPHHHHHRQELQQTQQLHHQQLQSTQYNNQRLPQQQQQRHYRHHNQLNYRNYPYAYNCSVNQSDEGARSSNKAAKTTLEYRYPPFFITFISIFELVSFVYYALRSEEPISLTGPVPIRSKLIYNPYRRYEVWRYLTYMFIHAGYWHLSFNLIIQLAVGIPLELIHKFNPIFIIYLGGVIGGALGNSIADPHSYLAGASSGCYALIAAHMSNLIINWGEIKGACCRLVTLLIFSATDFGTAVYERHFKIGSLAYRTSYGGHLAGAISGLLLGLIFLRNVRIHHWEQEVKKWAAGAYFGLIIFAILFNITNTDYFPPQDPHKLDWSANPFSFDPE